MIFTLGAIVLTGNAAWADANAAKPEGVAASKGGAKKVLQRRDEATLFLKVSGAGRAAASAVERVLKQRREVVLRPLNAIFQSKNDARPAVDKAFEAVGEGESQLANLEVEKGLKTLKDAVKKIEQHFEIVGGDEILRGRYVKALTSLALAYFLAGDASMTSEWLSRALVFDPKVDYDKKRFPPKMKELFDAVHFLAAELGKGKAVITTVPPMAFVALNGTIVGRAPARSKTLPVGRNLVTISALGYTPKTVALNVKGGKEPATVEVALSPLPSHPMALLAGAVEDVVAGKVTEPQRAATLLGVNLLILGTLTGDGDRFHVSLYAYDKNEKKIIGRSKGELRGLSIEDDTGKVLNGLFASIRLSRAPPKPKVRGPGFFSRMVRSKWFWPVVGAVAGAAAIAGATVGVVVATQGDHRRRHALLLPVFSAR